MKARKILLTVLAYVSLVCFSYFAYRYYANFQETKRQQVLFEKRKIAWETLRQKLINETSQFKGEAGIVIKDLRTNWKIFHNRDKLFPSASLAKIPIMSACLLAAEDGRLKLNRNVALKATDKLSGSGILKDTRPGATFTPEELIGFMIYDSDNTATNILTNIVGIDYLNNAFKVFGLKNTSLIRKVADFHARNKGIENYTTAEDMASILEQMYQGSLVNKNTSEKCLRFLKLQRVNDRIPKYLPVDVTVAHKTGLERSVCHDVGIVFTRKGDFLICVLTKHTHSNSVPCKELIAKIALHTYVYFEQLQEGDLR
jgi:beta-lactamase class A